MLGPGSGDLLDRDRSSARNINRPERELKGEASVGRALANDERVARFSQDFSLIVGCCT